MQPDHPKKTIKPESDRKTQTNNVVGLNDTTRLNYYKGQNQKANISNYAGNQCFGTAFMHVVSTELKTEEGQPYGLDDTTILKAKELNEQCGIHEKSLEIRNKMTPNENKFSYEIKENGNLSKTDEKKYRQTVKEIQSSQISDVNKLVDDVSKSGKDEKYIVSYNYQPANPTTKREGSGHTFELIKENGKEFIIDPDTKKTELPICPPNGVGMYVKQRIGKNAVLTDFEVMSGTNPVSQLMIKNLKIPTACTTINPQPMSLVVSELEQKIIILLNENKTENDLDPKPDTGDSLKMDK